MSGAQFGHSASTAAASPRLALGTRPAHVFTRPVLAALGTKDDLVNFLQRVAQEMDATEKLGDKQAAWVT